jgi:hypothetical protein
MAEGQKLPRHQPDIAGLIREGSTEANAGTDHR